MKRLFLLAMILSLCVGFSGTAFACSGGGHVAIEDMTDTRYTELFVKARVHRIEEDRGFNAILEVERYLQGTGNKYVAVRRWPAGLQSSLEREYSNGCGGNGGGHIWRVNESGYFTLFDNGDGTFTDRASGYYDGLNYFIEGGMITYWSSKLERLETVSEDTFEDIVLSLLPDSNVSEPVDNIYSYPLLRPLYITTENNARYIMDVDRSIHLLNYSVEPYKISPDGSHVAYRNDANTFEFYKVQLRRSAEYTPREENIRYGKELAFSPNSDFVVLWDDEQMTIHMFDNQAPDDWRGFTMNLQDIGQVDFANFEAAVIRQVLWSADSRSIAFTDARGIWLWNIYTMLEPELIVPVDALVNTQPSNLPDVQLLEISTSGRYIRYGNNVRWHLLDVLTGERLPNALVTPNETHFVHVNLEPENDVRSYNEGDSYQCGVPLRTSCPTVISQVGEVVRIRWQPRSIEIVTCNKMHYTCTTGRYNWSPSIRASNRTYLWGGINNQPRWFDYALYDEFFDTQYIMAYQENDYTVGIYYDALNYQEVYFSESYDLSDILDSPIASIEWGQPIFYHD